MDIVHLEDPVFPWTTHSHFVKHLFIILPLQSLDGVLKLSTFSSKCKDCYCDQKTKFTNLNIKQQLILNVLKKKKNDLNLRLTIIHQKPPQHSSP